MAAFEQSYKGAEGRGDRREEQSKAQSIRGFKECKNTSMLVFPVYKLHGKIFDERKIGDFRFHKKK